RHHARLPRRLRQGVEEEMRPAELVGAHRLQILALEPHRGAGQLAEALAVLERGAPQHRGEPLGRCLDLRGAHRQFHGIRHAVPSFAATTSAVAIAATPSPRPVSPSASVVLPETVTGAPAASLIAAQASSRRLESRGRLPITWTAMLPISKPASRTRRAASASRRAPEAPAHSGRSTPKWEPRSPIPAAENSASHAAW